MEGVGRPRPSNRSLTGEYKYIFHIKLRDTSHPARYNFGCMEARFQCAGCGEWNETFVDESAGSHQNYVEDCQICCKPNLLRVSWDPGMKEVWITAELE